MISLEKLMILTPLQKLPKNVGDLGKLIVAKGFEKVPKVQSGHTGIDVQLISSLTSLDTIASLLTKTYCRSWSNSILLKTRHTANTFPMLSVLKVILK